MNKIDVQLNGKWLSEEVPGFTVLSIEGRELLEKDLQTETTKGVDGSMFVRSRYPARTLKIEFFIRALTNEERGERYNKLASLLYGDEQKIIFSDEPDKYFVGSVTKSGAKEIQFLCSDPFKYSTVMKKFPLANNKFSIVNLGSTEVPIRYEIGFPSDCGYCSFNESKGTLELGNREEADKARTTGDEVLLTWDDFVSADYDRTGSDTSSDGYAATYRYPHNMKKVTAKGAGTGAVQKDYLELDRSTGEHAGTWVCGSKKVLSIPDDSNDDSEALEWRLFFFNWFETGQFGQTGEQSIAVLDSDNKIIGEFTIYKTDTAGNTVVVAFTTKNGKVKTFETTGGWWEPYGGGNRGYGEMVKRDNWVQFYYNGGYYKFYDDGLKTRKAAKIRITIADNLCNSKPVSINRISDIDFTKYNVVGYEDVENTFKKDDKLIVDGEERKTYLNNIYRPDLEILGSKFVQAKPGVTEVSLALSSWFTGSVTANAYIRERWL